MRYYLNKYKQFSLIQLFFAVFILLFSSSALSLESTLKFKHISTKEGLSQPYVFSIAQDHDGFIWVATEDGLNRYDGQEFIQYRHRNNDIHSIANNFIRKVFVDASGILWVGTDNGLSRYNVEQDNFDNFFHNPSSSNSLIDNQIWDIYQDNTQQLWVSTANGVHIFNKKNNTFERISISNIEDKLIEIKTIFQDKHGRYWFGTYDQGIYIADKNLSFGSKNGKQNTWGFEINATGLFEVKFIEGNYWLATDNGVYVVDQLYQIKHHYTSSSNPALLSNEIKSIEIAQNGNLWIATPNGLNILNITNGKLSSITASNKPLELGENFIYKIFKDINNSLWLGTIGQGLYSHKVSYDFFKTIPQTLEQEITSLYEDKNQNLWYASSDKLYRINTEGNVSNFNIKTRINEILYVNDHFVIALGFNRNLNIFNNISHPDNKQIFNLDITDVSSPILTQNGDSILYINSNKNLIQLNWKENLNKVKFKEQKFKNLYQDSLGEIWLINEKNELISLSSDLSKLTNKNIYLNYRFNDFTKFSVKGNKVWIYSDQGLYIYDLDSNKIKEYSEQNTLANNFINSLVFGQNYTWLITNRGISAISDDNKVINYYNDFLLEDKAFIEHSAIVTQNKKIYIGSVNGITEFNPTFLTKYKQSIPTPSFTNLLITNKNINLEKLQFTSHPVLNINKIKKIQLSYEQSPFSIDFIAPNAALNEHISYQYRLLGLSDKWIEANRENLRATYTNIDPGTYQFEVRVFDRYSPEKFKQKSITIEITPPWWLSTLAWVGYSLLIALFIGYLLLQAYHRRQFNLQIQQSEERLKLSLWGSGDEMWDWNLKEDRIYRSNIWGDINFPIDGARIKPENKQYIEAKSNKDQLKALLKLTNIHPQDLAKLKQALNRVIEQQEEIFEASYRVKNKNGEWVTLLDRGKVVERDGQGKAVRITGTLKDISQLKQVEERLKLFAKSIANISDAIAIYNSQFKAVEVNDAFLKITGMTLTQAIGHEFDFSLYPKSYTESIKKQIKHQGSWHGEIESIRQNGELYQTDVNVDVIKDENGRISHYVSVLSDISERKKNEEELRKLANLDTLTELPNRSYFQAKQAQLVKFNTPYALLVFDLDNFKKINDSLGHEAGDELLCQVAKRISTCSRSQDTLCRLGGDEFSLLIESSSNIHNIGSVAKAILKEIRKPLRVKNQEVVLHSSVGIVIFPEDGTTPEDLLKKADTAMYHAKNAGGNKYQFFNESMNQQAVKRLQVENLIRYGLKEDYFSVFYQPKIQLKTGKISGMEALVRFEHPKKGIISPGLFIPVSEETGQIVEIGTSVLRKACIDTKRWVDAGIFDGRVAVNLSAVQFTEPNLVKTINQILLETGLPAKYLELEITEGTVMDSPKKAIDLMLQIRSMGIHLALDDFGTGYSSLAYLKQFPLNTLKIDKAFVDDIEHSEQGRNMVATIVTIAHNLGLDVVAEGVEHQAQLEFLTKLQCEQLQGFLYSKPLSNKDFYQYMLSSRITANTTSMFTKQF